MDLGDSCPEQGCAGILEEAEREGSCSCHINPPCSHCTGSRLQCSSCGEVYDPMNHEEQPRPKKENNIFKFKSFDEALKELREGPRDKIDWASKGHTHFSMIKEGIFPIGTSRSEVSNRVKGTFGGRFDYFREETGDFKYIAYTD